MPYTLDVDTDRQRIFIVIYGVLTAADFRDYFTARQTGTSRGFTTLIECMPSEVAITPGEVRQLARARQALRDDGTLGRTAVVAASDLLFGMWRMYQLLA